MIKITRLFLFLLICFCSSNLARTCVIGGFSPDTTVISCDGNNAMPQIYWDIYLTAVKNVQPYIGKGEPTVVFGWKTGSGIANKKTYMTFSYLIITRSGKCYLLDKCPEVLCDFIDTKTNNLIDQYDVSEIIKLFQCDGYDFFEDMFDVSQYCDRITTNVERPSHSWLPYFYAMFDEKDQIHGATLISLDQVSYFPKNYINAMFIALFKSLERVSMKCSWEDMQLTEICR